MIAFNLLSFYLFYLGINPNLFGKTGDLCIINMFFLFLSHLSLGTIQVLRHQRADAHLPNIEPRIKNDNQKQKYLKNKIRKIRKRLRNIK